jgi:hypothetical protein
MKVHERLPALIAIPVCNEAERIGACLAALGAQDGAGEQSVVLLLNNCTDATASIVDGWRDNPRFRLHVEQTSLPPSRASAGVARALAMRSAARIAARSGTGRFVLLTTDADGTVPAGWVAANLDAITNGADAVCGRAVIDPTEAALIPARLHEDDARECAYSDLLEEIAALLDPDPADPWPRHAENSGASIAVTGCAYHAVGGVPPKLTGEDRAFIEALRRMDAKIRHAPSISVTVSGRIIGRASGGMADTIRRRLVAPDPMLDDRLEGATVAVRRARLRHVVRDQHSGDVADVERVGDMLRLAPDRLARLLDAPRFGMAWAAIEAASPRLARRPVPVSELPQQTAHAREIVAWLRAGGRFDPTTQIHVHPAAPPIAARTLHEQLGRGMAAERRKRPNTPPSHTSMSQSARPAQPIAPNDVFS